MSREDGKEQAGQTRGQALIRKEEAPRPQPGAKGLTTYTTLLNTRNDTKNEGIV